MRVTDTEVVFSMTEAGELTISLPAVGKKFAQFIETDIGCLVLSCDHGDRLDALPHLAAHFRVVGAALHENIFGEVHVLRDRLPDRALVMQV